MKKLTDLLKDGVTQKDALESLMDGFETSREFAVTVYNGKKGDARKPLWKVEHCQVKISYAGNSLAQVMGRDARSTTIAVQGTIRTKWTEAATKKAFASGKPVLVDPNNIAALEDPAKAKELAVAGMKHTLATTEDTAKKRELFNELLAAAGMTAADLAG